MNKMFFKTKKGVTMGIAAALLAVATVFTGVNSKMNSKADDNKILEMQRWINKTYNSVEGFQEIKETGYVNRSYAKSLVKVLQLELGMPTSEITGSFGISTFNACTDLKEGDKGNIVSIMQAGLYVNGYNQNGEIDGIYDSEMTHDIAEYQEFMCLPNTNGQLDKGTIKSLFTSNGDTNRVATSCDTQKKLDVQAVNKLKEAGYTYVGRYLTNIEGGLDKKMTREEAELIINNGMKIIPIFLERRELDYFTNEQGKIDVEKAVNAANELGLPSGTTLYFSVDYDMTAVNVKNAIAYFEGINEKMNQLGDKYSVGVYSTRRVCSEVSEKGLAKYSFVFDASIGYEGNLGQKMPSNWSFDQYVVDVELDKEIGLSINKSIVSGRDVAVSYLDK